MRPASALPFGGKYRVIDFTLSNCVHSGLTRIGVLTQYAPLSLQEHIGIGRAWDLDRRDGGIRLLQPYVRQRETNWYRGTADALVQNRNVIDDAQARHILVVSGDLIYKMDFGPLIERHEARRSALTIVTTRSPEGEPARYGAVQADAAGRVRSFADRNAGPAGRGIERRDRLLRPLFDPRAQVAQPLLALSGQLLDGDQLLLHGEQVGLHVAAQLHEIRLLGGEQLLHGGDGGEQGVALAAAPRIAARELAAERRDLELDLPDVALEGAAGGEPQTPQQRQGATQRATDLTAS